MDDASLDGVLDGENIADLARLGPERFGSLVESYARTAGELITSVEQAVAAADNDALRLAAHSLKGTSLTFGARRVAAVAAVIERAAADNDSGEASRRGRELQSEIATAIAALRAAAQRL